MIDYGSVCSGIEAASVAWEPLGWKPAWFSEIEPFPSAVLAHRWPLVPNLGDMTTIAARVRAGEVHAPAVLVGGTPCQSFSVAGLRAGLADPRGQLTISYVDLADAIDARRSIQNLDPCIAVWENVPGVLSHADNPFGCFLGAISGEDCELKPPGGGRKWADAGCVFGPVRTVAWRCFDAQYFGLAQRRKRVFVVASAGDSINPVEILFEFEGMRRDTAPSRSAHQSKAIAADAESGATLDDRVVEGERRGCWWDGGQLSQTLDAVLSKGQMMPEKSRFPAVLQPIAFSGKDSGNDAGEDIAPTLRAMNETGGNANGGGQVAVALAFTENAGRPGGSMIETNGDLAYSLTAPSGGSHAEKRTVAVAFKASHYTRGKDGAPSEIAPPLSADADKGDQDTLVFFRWLVRRLMPVECERLQGFPDGHTQVPYKGKPTKDSPRYKAIGNSMATHCMAWIGRRIAEAQAIPGDRA